MSDKLYLLIYREDETEDWEPWAVFYKTLQRAQEKILKVSCGSRMQYDIVECEHIWKKMVDKPVNAPEIVKERTPERG